MMGWYGQLWSRRQLYYIDSSKVTTNQTDFVVIINEDVVTEDFWNNVKNDGGDIVFTEPDGTTKLSRIVRNIDVDEKIVEIAVKIPSLSSSDDTGFCMYYGNPTGSETNDDIWTSEYNAVYNMNSGNNYVDIKKTTSYDGFGTMVKYDSDTLIHVFREGVDHWNGEPGKLVKEKYTISTDMWGDREDVYEDADPNLDPRDCAGGMIGTTVYIFFHRRDLTLLTTHDCGYVTSDDGGETWSSYTMVFNDGTVPWGSVNPTGTAGRYVLTGYNTIGVHTIATTDSGSSWGILSSVPASSTYNEADIAYIGNNKLIMTLRVDDPGGVVYQSVSSDDGSSWGAIMATNVGNSSGAKITAIIYDDVSGNVVLVYQDRHYGQAMISISDANTVFGSPTSWASPVQLMGGFNYNGYPSVIKIDTNKYYIVFSVSKEDGVSGSDADNYCGMYPFQTSYTDILDETSNDNDGTKSGSQHPSESLGKLRVSQFSETGQIIVPDSASLVCSGSLTLSFYVYLNEINGNEGILTHGIIDGNRSWAVATANTGRLYLWLTHIGFFASRWYYITRTYSISVNTWHHVVMTYNGATKTATCYIDGTSVSFYLKGTAQSSIHNSSEDVVLMNGFNQNMIGRLDEVRIILSEAKEVGWIKTVCNSISDIDSFIIPQYLEANERNLELSGRWGQSRGWR